MLLFCSDHYNRTAGTPAFLDGFCGISAEAVHWMADRGVKIFGVETISPDLVYLTDRYPTHRACGERGLTHYENLNNLVEVVGKRFEFYGFPLKLETAYGSPVRAVAILDDRSSLTAPRPADPLEGRVNVRRYATARSRRPPARCRGTPAGTRPASRAALAAAAGAA